MAVVKHGHDSICGFVYVSIFKLKMIFVGILAGIPTDCLKARLTYTLLFFSIAGPVID